MKKIIKTITYTTIIDDKVISTSSTSEIVESKGITKKCAMIIQDRTAYEVFCELYKSNPKLNKKKTALFIGVARPTIYDFIERYKKNVL